jgi:hypothetical protein
VQEMPFRKRTGGPKSLPERIARQAHAELYEAIIAGSWISILD